MNDKINDGGPVFPFECDNCGHKPTPQEVIDHHGACAKCGDSIVTFTVDAAEYIMAMNPNTGLKARGQ